MNKELNKAPISVKYDWENNPKVRPSKVEFKGVKSPIKKENKVITPDVTKGIAKGDGKMVDKIPMVRHDLVIGKRPGSPKKMEKYSSTDGSLTPSKEVKPAASMKEAFRLGFNQLFYSIMQEAADPNAAPPADPNAAPPADPNAAPPADPNAAPAGAEGAEDPAAALSGEAGGGLVGQLEEAYNTLESTLGTIQDEAAKEQLSGVKDTLAAAYEMLTGTPLAGAGGEDEGGAEGEGAPPPDVPNMEQGADPNAAPPADPNAAPPAV